MVNASKNSKIFTLSVGTLNANHWKRSPTWIHGWSEHVNFNRGTRIERNWRRGFDFGRTCNRSERANEFTNESQRTGSPGRASPVQLTTHSLSRKSSALAVDPCPSGGHVTHCDVFRFDVAARWKIVSDSCTRTCDRLMGAGGKLSATEARSSWFRTSWVSMYGCTWSLRRALSVSEIDRAGFRRMDWS